MGRRRFGGERSRPGSVAPTGGRIEPRRSPGRRSSTPTYLQSTCNADVVMKAGRLAAEYFVYKGRIPASLLLDADHRSRGNYLPPPPERRAPSPGDEDGHWRRSRDELRGPRRPRKRSRERRDDDDDDDRRGRGSESGDWGRKRGREKLRGKRGRVYSENAGAEDDLSPGLHHRRGRSRVVSGDSSSGKDRDVADGMRDHEDGRSERRSRRHVADGMRGHADGRSERRGRRHVADGMRGHADGRSERRSRRRGRDDDHRRSRRHKKEVKPGRSSKVSTKHSSSAGCRSPKASRRRGIDGFSSDSHASRTNGSKRQILVDWDVQSAKPVDESINPQDESCRSLLALKETVAVVDASKHDTSAHFSKWEEINKGETSSPPKVSQMNEHYPRGLKKSVVMVDTSEHDTSTPFDKREEINGGMVSSPSKVSQTNEHSPRGLKETLAMVDANKYDTFAHFGKREEINKGGASSPPKVSQTNEHSPRGLKESVVMVDASEYDTSTHFDKREEINGGMVSSLSKVSQTNEHSPWGLKETLELVDASKHDTSIHFSKREEINKGGVSSYSKVSRMNEPSPQGLKETLAMVDASEHDTSAPFDKREEIDKEMVSSPPKVSQTNEHFSLSNLNAPHVDEERWAAHRSPKANRRNVTDSFSNDLLANLANTPAISHIQSIESMDKSINSQDEACRSLQGLKEETLMLVDVSEHDTSASIDKEEEINKGRASSPLEVSQMNEHSPSSNMNAPQDDEERWAAHRSPEANRQKVTESFSNDPLANLANALEISRIQPVESIDKSINPQDKPCQSLQGLKEETVMMVDVSEHDTPAYIDKEEEIDKGRASSPLEVSQMNEHSPLSNLNVPQVDEERWVARRNPKANRGKATKSFSSNGTKSSHIQSVNSMDIPINPQDESCRSLQGLKKTLMRVDVKEHDTSANFYEEEIHKGRALSPLEVSQTNVHSRLPNLNAPQVDEERCAARRSPEANQGTIVASFSSDSLANLSNALDSSHIQSIKLTEKSINPQDESCQTLRGLKATVVTVGVREDEKEEINRGNVSSPVKLSKANEHSPFHNLRASQSNEEMTETFNQEQPIGHSVMPKCGSEYVVKGEEEKHDEPVSYKICDLNLVVSPEMSEIPSDSFWRNDGPTSLTLETKENISVDFGLPAANSISNGHDSSWISSNGKLVPIIFLDDDSEAEDDVCGSSKPRSEALYSSTENVWNHMPPRDGTPGVRNG